MIPNFHKVEKNIYRGAAPSIKDVIRMHKTLGIKKIISLDLKAGKRIDTTCKLLGIKHIMLPIEFGIKGSLDNFLHHNIIKLLSNGPTFIHCARGKDRTGMAIALYRVKKDNWSAEKAIKEAKSFGFGIGVDPLITHIYKKVIQKAENHKDINSIDNGSIVDNQREYPSDYRDYTLDGFSQQSWSPYSDYRVREFPNSPVDKDWPEQYETRITRDLDDRVPNSNYSRTPQVGQYDSNTNGINGAGPSGVGGGFV